MFYLTENEFAFCRIKEKSGVIFTLLSGPSHILHSKFGEGFIRTTTQTHTCLSFSARPPRCGRRRRRRPHRRDDDDAVVVMVVVVVFEEDTTKDDDDVIHGEDSKL